MREYFAIILLSFPLAGWADIHVCKCDTGADVDCVDGNDSTGDGSQGSPYQTMSKASAEYNALDPETEDLYLCRGGAWEYSDDQLAFNQTGTAANPVIFGAYGSGARPLLIHTAQDGANGVFDLSEGANAYQTFQDLDIDCAGSGIEDGYGWRVTASGVDHVKLDNFAVEGCKNFVYVSASNVHMQIEDGYVANGKQGFFGDLTGFSSTDAAYIDRVIFSGNGTTASTADINFASTHTNDFVRLKNNTHHDFNNSGGNCAGPAIRIADPVVDLRISGSSFRASGTPTSDCAAIATDGGSFQDLVITSISAIGFGGRAIEVENCAGECDLDHNLVITSGAHATDHAIYTSGSGVSTSSADQVIFRSNASGIGVGLHTDVSSVAETTVRWLGTAPSGSGCYNITNDATLSNAFCLEGGLSRALFKVSWDHNPQEDNVTSYTIEYSVAGGPWTALSPTVTFPQAFYDQEVLEAESGDDVCVRVFATNAEGNSDTSGQDCLTL